MAQFENNEILPICVIIKIMAEQNVFDGIIGHKAQIAILKQSIKRKNFAHAYLFCGSVHLGKTEVARRFIAGILGLPDFVSLDKHPDVKMVIGEKLIKIDQIRELKHYFSLAPYKANYKIALIAEAEKMNRPAASALLKTLEEPSGQAILILIAPSVRSILPTLVSRCQVFNFHRTSIAEIREGLIERGASEALARILAPKSQGLPGRALSCFKEPSLLSEEASFFRDFARLPGENFKERFAFAEKLAKEEGGIETVISQWLNFYHDLILAKHGALDLISDLKAKSEIAAASKNYTLPQVLIAIRILQGIGQNLKFNINKRLALETLLINI